MFELRHQRSKAVSHAGWHLGDNGTKQCTGSRSPELDVRVDLSVNQKSEWQSRVSRGGCKRGAQRHPRGREKGALHISGEILAGPS